MIVKVQHVLVKQHYKDKSKLKSGQLYVKMKNYKEDDTIDFIVNNVVGRSNKICNQKIKKTNMTNCK